MDKINSGGPAFPAPYHPQEGIKTVNPAGMTLRDYFAAKALGAFLDQNQFKRFDLTVGTLKATCDEAATRAYQVADAMLRARGAA